MHRLNVTVEYRDGDERDVEIAVSELVLFQWAARDMEMLRRQIDEYSKIGIKPRSMPEVYLLQPYLVTTSNYIRRISDFHAGSVHYVILIKNEDEVYITVGSDHSDKEAERCNILAGKHMYPKVVARRAWPLEEVSKHFDELVMRSWILEGSAKTLYQEGKLKLLLRPEKIIDQVEEIVSELRNVVVFAGTLPTVGGEIKVSEYFEVELFDPVLNRKIGHYYWID